MCLGAETWPLQRLACNINNTIDVITNSFPYIASSAIDNCYIKWNNNNYSCAILNVDENCHGTPTRTGFGGILNNNSGFFLASFSRYIPGTNDILVALSAIYYGLNMAKNLGVCRSSFLLWFSCLHEFD